MTTHHDHLFLQTILKNRTPLASVTALFSLEKNSPYLPSPLTYSSQACIRFDKTANTSNSMHLKKYWKRNIKDNI